MPVDFPAFHLFAGGELLSVYLGDEEITNRMKLRVCIYYVLPVLAAL